MRVRTRSILASLVVGAVGVVGLTLVSATPSNAVDAAPQTEQQVAYISVQVDGHEVGVFADVVVLGSRAKLAEAIPPPAIALSRAYGPIDDEVNAWHQLVKVGDPSAERNFSIIMYNELGEPVSTHVATNGYPTRIRVEGPVEIVTFFAEALDRLN